MQEWRNVHVIGRRHVPFRNGRPDLAAIIRANPGATFHIDNDTWWMETPGQSQTDPPLVDADAMSGDGHGHVHGWDVLLALAEIAGIKIERA